VLEDRFDLIMIDCGAGIGDNVLFFAGAAQEALLVISPEPTSLTDAYAAVKVLSQQAGVERFSVIVNQAPTAAHAREVFQKLTRVTDRFLTARVGLLGHAPRDENLHRALMAQRPVVELFPRSPVSRAMETLTRDLLAAAPPPALQGGLKFLFDRVQRETARA
jgi:flagellar biosynthesis protein FlhG